MVILYIEDVDLNVPHNHPFDSDYVILYIEDVDLNNIPAPETAYEFGHPLH